MTTVEDVEEKQATEGFDERHGSGNYTIT